jgi:hypothetical protein
MPQLMAIHRPSRSSPHRSRRGMALLLVLLVATLLFVAASFIAERGLQSLTVGNTFMQSQKAYYAAQAGVAVALYQLESNANYGGGAGSLDNGPEGYNVTVIPNNGGASITAPNGASIPPGMVYVMSVGRAVNGLNSHVNALVQMNNTPFGAAAFGINSVQMTGGATDSYDSSVGYAGSRQPTGNIATNNSGAGAEQFTGTTVNGTVYGGPGGQASGATPGSPNTMWFTGGSYKGLGVLAQSLVAPSLPPSGASGVDVNVTGGNNVLAPGTYGNVTVTGGTLQLSSGSYSFQNVTVTGTGVFSTSGSKIKMSIQQGLVITGGSFDNTVPGNLVIQVADGGSVTTDGPTLYLSLYAPGAHVAMTGGDLYGAVVANDLLIDGTQVHFDRQLANAQVSGASTWKIIYLNKP